MKRLILGLVILLLVLTGCMKTQDTKNKQLSINDITTYEETIKDGKVEIDGITYDVKSVTKIRNIYNDNENIIEKVTTNDENEMRIEFLYENNQLIEDRGYSNDELSFTNYYYYKDDLLIEKKTVHKGGLETCIKYSYGEKIEIETYYNSDGTISYILKVYLDDEGKIKKGISTDAYGETMESRTFYYDEDLLIKVIAEKDGIKTKTFTTEYNNIGDKIKDYIIIPGDKNTLIVNFYDIEYNKKLLPETVTIYRVQSQISDEDIIKEDK